MITARALIERNARTLSMLRFDGSEAIRSVQLYGTDPRTLGEAVRFLVGEIGVDHVDMNFGCPVPKVTRKGGGSALPVRRALLRNIIRTAVAAAGDIPVTIKFPIGVTAELLTYLETGRIAEVERSEERRVGEACVRTCRSRWSAFPEKKQTSNSDKTSI